MFTGNCRPAMLKNQHCGSALLPTLRSAFLVHRSARSQLLQGTVKVFSSQFNIRFLFSSHFSFFFFPERSTLRSKWNGAEGVSCTCVCQLWRNTGASANFSDAKRPLKFSPHKQGVTRLGARFSFSRLIRLLHLLRSRKIQSAFRPGKKAGPTPSGAIWRYQDGKKRLTLRKTRVHTGRHAVAFCDIGVYY